MRRRPGAGGMLLQWHVTKRCNLRCAHCRQSGFPHRELQTHQLLSILHQFRELVEARERELGVGFRGHITFAGGEPFVRQDFEQLLKKVAAQSSWTSFAVLTNGSLLDAARVRALARLRPAFVQVGIDGTETTHDGIRGRGNFRRTVAATERLVRSGIRTLISFTAHRDNYKEFSDVVELGCRLGVSRVWADRLIPQGRGSELESLSPEETRELFAIMRCSRDQARRRWFGHTEVAMHRALQFLEGGGRPYRCTAGDSILTVMPDGDLYPCRRMPVAVGNVMKTSLEDLYYGNETLRSLRDPRRVSGGCERCEFHGGCRGGLRCLARATTGDPFVADPGCWLASGQTSDASLGWVSP